MDFETVIGLEVHAQLLTRSKMFCRCGAGYASAPPNTRVCPVCLGMPGVLPTINRQAVAYTIMTGLALNCVIASDTKFDRKNYSYPDLMKGYQISQYDAPIAKDGFLEIEVGGERKKVGITRVHLEEDVAKLIHKQAIGESYSLMDVNRAGVPLMEIVGEPDLRSPEEAREYLVKLHGILQYLGVSTGNMEEGGFRCDANISVRPRGTTGLTGKVEVKNMNSFRAVFRALQFEAARQQALAAKGERLVQETRGWVEEKGETVSQRSKEYAHDYRYFPEPDLPPLAISRDWVEEIKATLPELPEARRDRFMRDYELPRYDADLLTGDKAMADYEEAFIAGYLKTAGNNLSRTEIAKLGSNWLQGEVSRIANAANIDAIEFRKKVSPEKLVGLVNLAQKGDITGAAAKSVLEIMFQTGKDAAGIVTEQGLGQISDNNAIIAAARAAIAANPAAVADYKSGKETAIRFLVGQVMKATRGRANPQMAASELKKLLEEG
ncbi:MAG: Asp-tRNA(Asn)/Glu-tRNA(Gln) amidotransferase subunit GatB [Dehalococcoidia bacterium]|nr:MAG: Asp-tRNA(Asn)/Glu-tRNA(Gln) amidotransferase subunit GatB [Dehalococcoidia bacterium]